MRTSWASVLVALTVLHVRAEEEFKYTYPSICPNVQLQQEFDLTKWHGLWYQKRHNSHMICRCSESFLHYEETGKNIKFDTRLVFYNGTVDYINNFFRIDKSERPNGQQITLYDKYMHFEVFYILATDYENYSIKYGCYDMNGVKTEYVVILGRHKDKPISDDVIQKTQELIKQNGIGVNLSDEIEDCTEFYNSKP